MLKLLVVIMYVGFLRSLIPLGGFGFIIEYRIGVVFIPSGPGL